jgi:hypothetical protein
MRGDDVNFQKMMVWSLFVCEARQPYTRGFAGLFRAAYLYCREIALKRS